MPNDLPLQSPDSHRSTSHKERSPRVYGIIPAAGVGARMEASCPKQYLMLTTHTILEETLAVFQKSERLDGLYVGIAKEDPYFVLPEKQDFDQADLDCTAPDQTPIHRTEGGESRAETVFNAMDFILKSAKAVSESEYEAVLQSWALVHDAARPGLSSTELDQFIDAVLTDNHPYGGIMALPAQDTIKKVGSSNTIEKTLNRDHIWLAQTPQMMPFELLYTLLAKCLKENAPVTDEASVLEYNERFPKVYRGYTHNFKITYPGDLELMRLHFKGRERCE